nr:glycoside hydrolase family 2 TIM barrel-domain containing protein [Angustibacter aerolatus]
MSTPSERVRLRLGFRTIAIEDGVLRVNGRRIQFRGVNRHDFDPDHGRALPDGLVRDEPAAHEAAQRERHPHQPRPAARRPARPRRRASASG